MKNNFKIHTIESAPEASKPTLQAAKKKMGFVPNLMATMSESPVMVESYLALMGLFDKSRLSETERQIILMTNNRLNGCTYCMAAHTAVSKMAKVDEGVIKALRSGSPLNDPKLEALRKFAIIINETRGWATDKQVEEFLAAGYTKETVLEVIVGTGLKVLSNYSTHVAEPDLDKAFVPLAWSENMAIVGA
ncbi:carboxymuconolactone decarboxylase family protein [Allomuricauda sp. SCSIO 65647]|uniref:carboxymuconolactone decarboxylase family protein n=1 Tax=Allomuricauda sp. SCSIO 65647 TaxID=2908843 RepID=UPI001F27F322|nr:carboxymuconolactone decarboxylase family protein [Muricauda sp. SCSIO 65647]UJH68606.1 carboxymuconolactone decarboxylase family protein [Muricauda sp. SCSIO 65647]